MTTECAHRLWNDPDGLPCVETGPHHTHTYRASAGADLDGPHRHVDQEDCA